MHALMLVPSLDSASIEAAAGARGLDLLGLGIVLLFLVLGAMRGLWWQLVRLFGITATVSVARAAAPRLAPTLQSALPGSSPAVVNGIAWMLILLAGFVGVALVGRLGRATLQAVHLSLLDRVGGAVAGAVSGILVHAALVIVLCLTTSKSWSQSAVGGTRSASLVDALGRGVPRMLDAQAAESLHHALPEADADR
jgi:uncharacterized membrane protein required for colicin V production